MIFLDSCIVIDYINGKIDISDDKKAIIVPISPNIPLL